MLLSHISCLSFSTIYFHQNMPALFNNSAFEVSQTTNKIFYTRLATSLKYSNIYVVVTPYLSNYTHLPVIQTQQVHQVPQPPVDFNPPRHEYLLPFRYYLIYLVLHETQSQVDVRADQGIVEPQYPTQVIEPNTESNIQQQSTRRTKLQVRRKRSDKVVTVSEPT